MFAETNDHYHLYANEGLLSNYFLSVKQLSLITITDFPSLLLMQ